MFKVFKEIYRDAMRYRHMRKSADEEMWNNFKNVYPFAKVAFDRIVDRSMRKATNKP